MAANDAIVLSYHDSLIRSSDFKLLNKTMWLNDNIIGFAFEFFEKDQFAKFSSSVSFVGPHVTQCFKMMSDEEAKLLIEPLNITEKELIFFAVNDNMSRNDGGGSHWSLLVLSVQEKICRHYDSMGIGNAESALKVFKILKPMFHGKLVFENAECPQQTNSHDCGVYVICVAEFLCSHIYLPSREPVSIVDAVNSRAVRHKREELKDIILKLSKSGTS